MSLNYCNCHINISFKYNASSVIKIDFKRRRHKGKEMVNLEQLPQIFGDHLDGIRNKLDSSKQMRLFIILGQWLKPAQVK